MTDLFRRQAIDHQRLGFHGAIVLTRSPVQTAWTALLVLIVVALVAFAATQGFARRQTVDGTLQPAAGQLRLVAPQAGVVIAGGPLQGQAVAAGDAVVRLATDTASGQGATQEAVALTLAARQRALADELQQQQAQARQQGAALAARIANAEAGIAEHAHELGLQRERVALVQDVAARYPALVRSGAVSPVEAAEKANELLDQQARLATLERARLNLQRELAGLRAEAAALPLVAGREGSQLKREVQALAQQQAETAGHREAQVLAPQAGELATLLAAPGQSVAAGQTLATLLPAGATLEAELWVPTRAAGFVRAGTPVTLRVDAFPYARYGQLPAHVREVSQSAVAPGDLVAGGADAQATDAPAVYRVRVALDPAPAGAAATAAIDPLAWRRALKAGMHVQASLVGEKRTLVEWALEPLAALKVAAK